MSVKEFSTTQLLAMAETNKFDAKLVRQIKFSNLHLLDIRAPQNRFFSITQGIIGASITLDIFWSIIFLSSLSFMMMAGLIGIVCFSALALALGMGWKHYIKTKKEQDNRNKQLEMALCKELIYQELLLRVETKVTEKASKLIEAIDYTAAKQNIPAITLIRNGINLIKLRNNKNNLYKFAYNHHLPMMLGNIFGGYKIFQKLSYPSEPNNNYPRIKSINEKSKIIKAILEGISLTTVIFGSFFACVSYMLMGLGLVTAAAALSNPVVIGTILAFTLFYGSYHGFQCYQSSIVHAKQKRLIHCKEQQSENFKDRYDYAVQIIGNLKKTKKTLLENILKDTASFDFFRPENKVVQQPTLRSARNLSSTVLFTKSAGI